MLIYGCQTNLSQKHLANENVLGGLSKCGRYVLDVLDFWSKVVVLLNC